MTAYNTALLSLSDSRRLVDGEVCYYCSNLSRSGPVVHSHWLGDDEGDCLACFIHPMCEIERDAPRAPAERAATLNDIAIRLTALAVCAD